MIETFGSLSRWRFLLARCAGVALAVVASSYFTLLSFYGPTQVALAAPLAGVVVVVFLTATHRTLVADVASVGIVSFIAITVQVADWRLGVVGASTSLVQGFAVLGSYRLFGRWTSPIGGLRTLVDATVLGLAVVAAAVVSSALRWTGLGLIEPSDVGNVVLTTIRTLTWGFVIGALGLMWAAGDRLEGLRSKRGRGAGPLEAAAGLSVTIALLLIAFPRTDPLPVVFPIFLVVVWAAVRLCAIAAVGFSNAIGTVAVVGTVIGVGSFAEVADPRVAAVLAQGLLLCLVVVTLALSLSVRETQLTSDRLRRAVLDSKLRALERDLVLANLAEGVVLLRPNGEIVLRNEAGRAIFGRPDLLPLHVVPSASTMGLRNADGRALPDRFVAEMISGATTVPREVKLSVLRPDHATRVIDVRTVRADTSEVEDDELVVATFRDVTEQHESTEELRAFAGVVAHDLAKPLTLITGWAEMLESTATEGGDPSPAIVQRFSARILRASSTMQALLHDLLTLTLARDRELIMVDVDVTAICREWARGQSDPDGAHRASVDVDDEIWVRGDKALLRQVFTNLLANAVKYVAPGVVPYVTVSATDQERDQDRHFVLVRVADNGIGIPGEEAGRIFEEFYRSSRGREEYQGTGIGLAICRRVVERHGGSIRAAPNSAGGGSTFELTLPTRP